MNAVFEYLFVVMKHFLLDQRQYSYLISSDWMIDA